MPTSALAKFQTVAMDSLLDRLTDIDYLVPMLVSDWGAVAGTPAAAMAGEWDAPATMEMLADNYRDLATTTARLLALFSVDSVGGDAITTVTNKLSAAVDPLTAISSRVDRLYRAYRMDEMDRVRHEAELLWVGLEYRCDRITGQSFGKVLK